MVNNLSGYVNFKGVAPATQVSSQKVSKEKTDLQAEQSTQSYSASNVRAYGTTGIKNSLNTEESQQKYSLVSSMLEPETKVALSGLLKSGTLLNNNSNDGSSVLDNLHKIATEPRIKGLDTKTLLTEAIQTISNPNQITQRFGDIPESVSRAVYRHPELGVRSAEELDVNENSNCCVAASIEYNLASTNPAEFVRMAAGLSSEDYSTTKNLALTDIAQSKEDALWVLEKFNLPHTIDENDRVNVTISPDRNAIIRARVQTSYRDPGERSSIDVLMQSAFMNVGSAQTYNALNDTRGQANNGIQSSETSGLSNYEATVTENIVSGVAKDTVGCISISATDMKLIPLFGQYTPDVAAEKIQEKMKTMMPEGMKDVPTEQVMEIMPEVMPSIVKETIEEIMNANISPDFEQTIKTISDFQTNLVMQEKMPSTTEELTQSVMPEIMNETVRKSMQVVVQDVIGNSIINALSQGQNVMIGYYPVIDEINGTYIPDTGGHEMTIVDVEQGFQGETIFICKDTMNEEPIGVPAAYLLPRLDHASLPKDLIDYGHLATILDTVSYFRQESENA